MSLTIDDDADNNDADIVDPAIARRRRETILVRCGQALVLVGFLAAWQLASPHLDPAVFSSPVEIAARLWQWITDGTLWFNLAVTVEEVVIGYVVGCALGIVFGLVLGSFPILARILDPIVMAIYGVPKIAFGPLFVVWFGINITPKVVITALMVFFFMFLATYEGTRGVDRDLRRAVRLMGATKLQERRIVVIPGSLPSILLGLKLAIPEALIGAIVGELIVSNRGIGYLVEFSASQLDSAGVFAGLFVLMVLVLLANAVVSHFAGRSRPDMREA